MGKEIFRQGLEGSVSKGVFIHNPGTHYDDDPAVKYHFPKQYLNRAKPFVGDYVLYYQSGKNGRIAGYTGTAFLEKVIPDLRQEDHYYAKIENGSYAPFPEVVPFRINGEIANSFIANEDGSANRGKQVWAVRQISNEDYFKILSIAAGEMAELPRVDEIENEFSESPQAEFISAQPREVVEVILNKKVRDRMFRTRVVKAYNKTCAFTGLNFVNGGGRAEVQAAHIRPVEHNGPDSIGNAIALSGTIHWMFDRGLLALSDDYDIMVSRKVNNLNEVNRLLVTNRKMIMPDSETNWPSAGYMQWHRNHHSFQQVS